MPPCGRRTRISPPYIGASLSAERDSTSAYSRRAVSTAWFEVGRFLGPNIEEFHAQEPDLPALWRRAGIDAIHERRMSFGAGIVVTGTRDGQRPT